MLRRLPYGANYLSLDEMHELKYCIGQKILFRYQTTGESMADKFEATATNLFNIQHALAVHNCTEGLRLALLSTKPKVGDKVYIPSVAFIAVAGAVLSCGLIPVLIDVDNTFSMDISKIPKDAERVIFAHMEGVVGKLPTGIPYLIEDAAQALGGRHIDGKYAGSAGYCGVFSFHHNKILTSGEGGLIITNNSKAWDLMKLYHDHGCNRIHGLYPSWENDTFYGENCVTNEVIASIQLQQFRHLENVKAGLERGYKILRDLIVERTFIVNDRNVGDLKLSLRLEFESQELRSKVENLLKVRNLPFWTLDKYYLPDHPVMKYRNSVYSDNFPWSLVEDYELPQFLHTYDKLKRTLCLAISPELHEADQIREAKLFIETLIISENVNA